MNPSSIIALTFSALSLAFMSKTDLAIERAQRAIKLSPFDSMLFGPYTALAAAHVIAGNPQEAAENARRAIRINPRFTLSHVWLVLALVEMGDIEGAKAEGRNLLEVEPSFTVSGFAKLAPSEGRAWLLTMLDKAALPT